MYFTLKNLVYCSWKHWRSNSIDQINTTIFIGVVHENQTKLKGDLVQDNCSSRIAWDHVKSSLATAFRMMSHQTYGDHVVLHLLAYAGCVSSEEISLIGASRHIGGFTLHISFAKCRPNPSLNMYQYIVRGGLTIYWITLYYSTLIWVHRTAVAGGMSFHLSTSKCSFQVEKV